MKQDEVNLNYDFFVKNKKIFISEGRLGQYALIHKQEIIQWFFSEDDAINTGIIKYKLGNFSIQKLSNIDTNDIEVNLGYYSYV